MQFQSGYYSTESAANSTFANFNMVPPTAVVPASSAFVAPSAHTTLAEFYDFTTGSLPSNWAAVNNSTGFQSGNTMNSSQVTSVAGVGTFLTVNTFPGGGTTYQGGTVWTSTNYTASVGCRVRMLLQFPSIPGGVAVGIWGGPWMDSNAGANPVCELDIAEVNLSDTVQCEWHVA